MSGTNNHEKLLVRILGVYRGVLIIVVAAGVLGLFKTHELVVRVDERLKNVESRVVNIEERQYKMQARDAPDGEFQLSR